MVVPLRRHPVLLPTTLGGVESSRAVVFAEAILCESRRQEGAAEDNSQTPASTTTRDDLPAVIQSRCRQSRAPVQVVMAVCIIDMSFTARALEATGERRSSHLGCTTALMQQLLTHTTLRQRYANGVSWRMDGVTRPALPPRYLL